MDSMQAPVGGRIKEVPTPGKKYQKLNNSTYMSEVSIAKCTSCVRGRCNGRCDEILELERQNVDPRKKANGKMNGYKAKRNLSYKGKMYSKSELAKMAGISLEVMMDRLGRGWTIEEAVETPKGARRPRKE